MRKFAAALFIFHLSSFILHAQQSFDREQVEVGNIGLSVTNVGTIGNPNIVSDPQGEPSMEYPLNSGIEHLFEGGLWIGAQVNGQTAVSTGAIDASTGYTTGASGFEFSSEVGNTIQQRSSLSNSDYFSLDAISHQDLLADFTDQYTIVPGTTIPITDHTLPLGADVHLETYAWNFSYADYFVILNYTITNNSTNTWDSVWLGMWTDLVVRNVNVATDAGTAFFNKGGNGFVDSLFADYAYDINGDPGYTNSYGACQFLGMEWRNQFINPVNAANVVAAGYPSPEVNANFWNYKTFDGSQFGAPSDDVQRYVKLKQGLDVTNSTVQSYLSQPNNHIQLVSAGPLISVDPGESFTFVIAMVAANQLTGGVDDDYSRTELLNHLGWAKRTYLGEDVNENGVLDAGEDLDDDNVLDRYILPEPPAIPKVKIVTTSNHASIYWDNQAEFSIDPISKKMDFEGYKIYRSNAGDDLNATTNSSANLIAQWDKPGDDIGYNNGFTPVQLPSPVQFDGDTTHYYYKYDVNGLLNGWQYVFIITSFDEGDADLNLGPLESSLVANTFRVFTGTDATDISSKDDTLQIGVYPNPYRISAAWDGATSQTKKIYFYNLPSLCDITIYTLSGDVVAILHHDANDNMGEDIHWYQNYAGDASQRILASGEHAWDLLSTAGQSITQGIYLFSVKDLKSGLKKQGQFVVVK